MLPAASLPEDGDLRLGSVSLSGKRVHATWGPGEPVAWVTREPVPDAGRVWLAISAMAESTGLQPVLYLDNGYGGGQEADFHAPCDAGQLDRIDAREILAGLWGQKTVVMEGGRALEEGDPGFDPTLAEEYQPFSRQFPGLAPYSDGELTGAEIVRAVDSLPSAHLCLAAAARAADLPAVTGWVTTDAWPSPLPVSAVLRSWEDRFGARLVQLGPGAEIRLLVGRPPRSQAAAQAVTAEIWAFADAWIDRHHEVELTTLSEIIPNVLDASIWGFWWDLWESANERHSAGPCGPAAHSARSNSA